MLKLFSSVLLVVLLAACGTTSQREAVGGVQDGVQKLQGAAGTPIPGQYIVVMNRDLSTQGVKQGAQFTPQSAEAFSLAVTGVSNELGIQALAPLEVINGFVAKFDAAKLATLERDPRVSYIEQDQIVTESATQNNPPAWGIDRIDGRLDGSYGYAATGAGVTAYIIDTGINRNHQDFEGRVVGGVNATGDGRGSSDCRGHGTHVAGTVGSRTYGVAKEVTLFSVRVLGCDGKGTNSGVIAGVNWVAQNAERPAVANMSLSSGVSEALDGAVNNAVKAGISFAVAAGNNSGDACSRSPARASEAVTVGATTRDNSRSSFSNYGGCVDIFAPGSGITSTWFDSNTATNTISGTSMATPHVTGVMALILQSNKNASPAAVTKYLTDKAQGGLSDIGPGSPNKFLYKVGF